MVFFFYWVTLAGTRRTVSVVEPEAWWFRREAEKWSFHNSPEAQAKQWQGSFRSLPSFSLSLSLSPLSLSLSLSLSFSPILLSLSLILSLSPLSLSLSQLPSISFLIKSFDLFPRIFIPINILITWSVLVCSDVVISFALFISLIVALLFVALLFQSNVSFFVNFSVAQLFFI